MPIFGSYRRLPLGTKPSPSPCLNCPKADRCRGQELACVALEIFENSGGRLSAAPRQPSRDIWLRLHDEE